MAPSPATARGSVHETANAIIDCLAALDAGGPRPRAHGNLTVEDPQYGELAIVVPRVAGISWRPEDEAWVRWTTPRGRRHHAVVEAVDRLGDALHAAMASGWDPWPYLGPGRPGYGGYGREGIALLPLREQDGRWDIVYNRSGAWDLVPDTWWDRTAWCTTFREFP